MTDARFPERWLNDRRILRLSDGAFRLFVLANAWSVTNRTDGVLYEDDLCLISTADRAKAPELAKVDLWKRDRDRWLILDFATTQSTKDELDHLFEIRKAQRDRKRKQRLSRDGHGTSHGTDVTGQSPGTAQARQGKARQGQDRLGSSPPEVGELGSNPGHRGDEWEGSA